MANFAIPVPGKRFVIGVPYTWLFVFFFLPFLFVERLFVPVNTAVLDHHHTSAIISSNLIPSFSKIYFVINMFMGYIIPTYLFWNWVLGIGIGYW